ncbi:MAG: ATPase [Spirochaetes bacterium GWF1_49_6]|nr:MAG: ATPase [Spirochaetes bacterium GWF1_49_6]
MIERVISKNIQEKFFKGKAILIIGPHQTGKTTLLKQITVEYENDVLWLNGDESDVREMLAKPTSTRLKGIIGNKRIVVIDEAQRIENIGLTLKLMVDNILDIQIIVTGSSAIDLTDSIKEPLTGRKYEYHLYPFSFEEMAGHTSSMEENRLLEQRMIYGYYPEVVNKPGEEKEVLRLISEGYLYKDIFMMAQIKKPVILEKLVLALALQLGSEVSYNELGQIIGSDKETLERYIDLLEKTFVVFRLPSLARNMRNEIKKGRKIYFYDNGIRNAIIKNFNPLALRQDTGALWENFIISERKKRNDYSGVWCNRYFWRTITQQEIDYIEEMDGKFTGYEFKWGRGKQKAPQSFLDGYPGSEVKFITRENYIEFVTTGEV